MYTLDSDLKRSLLMKKLKKCKITMIVFQFYHYVENLPDGVELNKYKIINAQKKREEKELYNLKKRM